LEIRQAATRDKLVLAAFSCSSFYPFLHFIRAFKTGGFLEVTILENYCIFKPAHVKTFMFSSKCG
jgi:hypothetical protein